jgi:hypothetical protein
LFEIFEEGRKKRDNYRTEQASSGYAVVQRQLTLRRISYFNPVVDLLPAKTTI